MTRVLLLCLLVVMPAAARAQWIHQNPVPTGFSIRDIAYIAPNNIIAVGNGGCIHLSTDGGAGWIKTQDGTADAVGAGEFNAYTAVHVINDEVAIAVCSDASIAMTRNGGARWSPVDVTSFSALNNITFLDDRTGVAVGNAGCMLRTDDGGRSWRSLPIVTFGPSLLAVAMRSPIDWVVSTIDGAILRTGDSGRTWRGSIITPRQSPVRFTNIRFADSLHGVAVGTHGPAGTTDGGATWQYQRDIPSSELLDVAHTAAGWVAVGRHGFIMRSDDGTSWQRVASGTTQDLVAISFLDGLRGIAMGSGGTVLRSTDGGIHFNVLRDPPLPDLRAVSFCDTLHGTAVGLAGTMLQTTNGGASWVPRASGITTDLVATAFATPATGIVAGGRELHHTSDSGATWQLRLTSEGAFTRVVRRGTRMLAIDTRGALHASDDTGMTWRAIPYGQPIELHAACIIDDDAWVIAGRSTILLTSNAGVDWVVKDGFPRSTLQDVQFVDRRTGWVLDNMSLMRTTNGGVTFETIIMPGVRVHFTDALHGVLMHSPGVIRQTTDGGISWSAIDRVTPPSLYGLDVVDAEHAWAVGDRGAILSTHHARPLVAVEAPAAPVAEWTLEAWPQPAHGVLNVALRGDLRATVTLRLVDMLGRAAGGVIERAPGANAAVFDVGMLPPGAYAIIASTPDATRVHRILTY